MATMVDFRPQLPAIRDQGRSRSTCVAFAATANHEWIRGDGEQLSAEFLNWAAKQRDGLPFGTQGTTLKAASQALSELGQPPEQIWPYDETRDERAPAYLPPVGACQIAEQRRLKGGLNLLPRSDVLRGILESGHLALLGVVLHATWHYATPSGQIAMPTLGVTRLGGHAVLVVGFDDGVALEDGLFFVRNTWGTGWGDAGYGYLPYNYVDAYGIEAWDLHS